MAKTLTSSLIVRLIDQVSAPARKVSGALLGINKAATGGASVTARLAAAQERNNRALDRARAGLFDAAAGFYTLKAAFGAPLNAAANFETQLEDIGQKIDKSVEDLPVLGEKIKQIARDTNQATTQIASAIDALVGRGASEEVALAAADPIGKAATAYRAATDDLASASWAAVDNLKVPADQIETALDMMAQAGKDGAFELRDMAQYFPSLGAAYQGLGQTGVNAVGDLAAALQVVRKGTGDASSAATNLQNVLQKIYAPATVKKFSDNDIDIFKEMAAAAERGLTPIEAIAEITNKTLKGDLSKLGNLFEDAQVQAGMRALIQNMDEYRRIRAETLKASGVVDADFERRIRTARGAMDRWNASIENLNITLGTTLLPVLNDVLDKIIPIINKVGEWVSANPQLASGIATAAAGLIAFKVAIAGLKFVGLLGRGGALSLLSIGFNTVGRASIGAWRGARNAIALQSALAKMNGVNYTFMQRIIDGFKGIGRSVPGVRAAAGAAERLNRATVAAGRIKAPSIWKSVANVGLTASLIDAAPKTWEESVANGDRINKWLEDNVGTPRSWLGLDKKESDNGAKANVDKLSGDLSKATQGWHIAAQEGMRSYVQALATGGDDAEAKASAIADQVKEMLTVNGKPIIDTSDLERALSIARHTATAIRGLGSANSGTAPAQAASGQSGHRANGGPVWPGGAFLVGERGEPEIFTPKTAGTITPASKAGGSVVMNNTFNISGGGDPETIARKVERVIERRWGSNLRGLHADMGARD